MHTWKSISISAFLLSISLTALASPPDLLLKKKGFEARPSANCEKYTAAWAQGVAEALTGHRYLSYSEIKEVEAFEGRRAGSSRACTSFSKEEKEKEECCKSGYREQGMPMLMSFLDEKTSEKTNDAAEVRCRDERINGERDANEGFYCKGTCMMPGLPDSAKPQKPLYLGCYLAGVKKILDDPEANPCPPSQMAANQASDQPLKNVVGPPIVSRGSSPVEALKKK